MKKFKVGDTHIDSYTKDELEVMPENKIDGVCTKCYYGKDNEDVQKDEMCLGSNCEDSFYFKLKEK